MKPLIEITTIPIQIEMKSTQAKLERAQGTAEVEVSRDESGVSVKSRSVRINLDTFESGVSSALGRLQPVAYEATDAYASQGQLTVRTHLAGQAMQSAQLGAEAGQSLPVENSVLDSEELSVRYEMDKLSFDWMFGQSGFEFTPGDIEFKVTQRPEVVIKYIGGPIYVPPSSDPDYESVDVKA